MALPLPSEVDTLGCKRSAAGLLAQSGMTEGSAVATALDEFLDTTCFEREDANECQIE